MAYQLEVNHSLLLEHLPLVYLADQLVCSLFSSQHPFLLALFQILHVYHPAKMFLPLL